MRELLKIMAVLLTSTTLQSGAQVMQSSAKTAAVELERQELRAIAPVVVNAVRVDGREVGLLPFSVNPNDPWLKHLSIEVANRSKIKIDGIAINLVFPETGTGSRQNPIMAHEYQWGATNLAIRNAPLMDDHSVPTPLNLAAGSTATVDLGPLFMEYEERLRTHLGATMPTRIQIEVDDVTFSNGVEWYGNAFFRRSSAGSITPVDSKEMLPQ